MGDRLVLVSQRARVGWSTIFKRGGHGLMSQRAGRLVDSMG